MAQTHQVTEVAAPGAVKGARRDPSAEATPERVGEIAESLLTHTRESIGEIDAINLQTRVLAINAQIEAVRAGEMGRSFAIVGQEMVGLSRRTRQAADLLGRQTEALLLDLANVSHRLSVDVRGRRLADLALTNIDLVDRNLFERTADVRWWATDAAVVQALAHPDEVARAHASQRLGVILRSYTVYYDIVLADLDGRIVANGRPDRYASVGHRVGESTWFQSAMATRSGDEFGFESVHVSPLVGGERVLVYSCKVCRDGDARGEPLGVLGIVFDWDGLAQTIVEATPIDAGKKSVTRVCLCDGDGLVLADSDGRQLEDRLRLPGQASLFTDARGSAVLEQAGHRLLVGHAQAPGFETYCTGWHSVIIETSPL